MKKVEDLLRNGGTVEQVRPLLLEYFEKRLKEHADDLEYERTEFREAQGRNPDVSDQSAYYETLEGLTNRMEGNTARIKMIRTVIKRIAHDSRWHECEECGMHILDRLLIGRPTTLCVSCQEEKENARNRTRIQRHGHVALAAE